ncbi:MAG: glutamate--cysteine ligase [Methanosphaera sp.]|nr:glutamate--cysteine ligase [Methanosphaera sp.]
MKDFFNVELLKSHFTSDEILGANFGLEREGLRVHSDGMLSLTKHPEIFGDKLKNPNITTDFSESQVEMITPTFNSTKKAHDFLLYLTDYVNRYIADDEYIWNQSIPCILPPSNEIPIAQYATDEKSVQSYKYRQALAKKYGTKKQLISGIHYNFSFKEDTIRKLYEIKDSKQSYKKFKNELYLKIVRNYLRYKWVVIYLTGCSIASHESFTCDCIKLMNTKHLEEYYTTEGVSFRNASCGYKNLIKLFPRYDSLENFISDVNGYIDEGKLSEAKELYTQIRMKSKNPNNLLESLSDDGISYLEIRTVDINSFDICGLSQEDMDFLHLFILFLLLFEESDYDKWQEESLLNEELVAQFGQTEDLELIKDGKRVLMKDWLNLIYENMGSINNELDLSFDNELKSFKDRMDNPEKLYSSKLLNLVKKDGYIKTQVQIAKNNKKDSISRVNSGYYDDKEYEIGFKGDL